MNSQEKEPQQSQVVSQQRERQKLQIATSEEMSRGRYSNNLLVSHTAEEFVFDWLLNSASGTFMVSRIIVSPGHLKRIIRALSDNLQKYEQKFGELQIPDPKDQTFE